MTVSNKLKEYNRAYYQKHKERLQEYARQYYQKHKEEIKRRTNSFYHSHKYRNAIYYRNKVNSGKVAQYIKKRKQHIVNAKISMLLYSLSHQAEILDEKRKREELRKKKKRELSKKYYYKQKENGTLRTYQDRRDYLRAYHKEYYLRKRKQNNEL